MVLPTYFMIVTLRPTRAYKQRDELVMLQWSGLWDVILLQTLCWETGDESRSWNNSILQNSIRLPFAILDLLADVMGQACLCGSVGWTTLLQYTRPAWRRSGEVWSMSDSSLVHAFEPFFWTGELLDNFRLKDRAKFHGQFLCRSTWAAGHVTSCLQWCCLIVLKDIYNV